MPQASQETLDEYMRMGGEGPADDQFALDYLAYHGWTLTRKWTWIPPAGVTNLKQITDEEWTCMQFLFEEWDYGGIDEDHHLRLISASGDTGGTEVRSAGVVENVEGMSEQGAGVCEVCDTAPEEQCSGC